MKKQEETVDTGEESKFNRRTISIAAERDTQRTKESNSERKRLCESSTDDTQAKKKCTSKSDLMFVERVNAGEKKST